MSPIPDLPPPPPGLVHLLELDASMQRNVERMVENLRQAAQQESRIKAGQRPTRSMRDLFRQWEKIHDQLAKDVAAHERARAEILAYGATLQDTARKVNEHTVRFGESLVSQVLQPEYERLKRENSELRTSVIAKQQALHTAYHTSHKLLVRMCAVITVPAAGLLIARWLLG